MTKTIELSIQRIRSYAKAKGWPPSRLAKEAGMGNTTLRNFHNPDWNPTASILKRLEGVIPDGFMPPLSDHHGAERTKDQIQ